MERLSWSRLMNFHRSERDYFVTNRYGLYVGTAKARVPFSPNPVWEGRDPKAQLRRTKKVLVPLIQTECRQGRETIGSPRKPQEVLTSALPPQDEVQIIPEPDGGAPRSESDS